MSNCVVQLIGKPVIPPYWSLGFQLSRWDYGSLSEVKKTVERNRAVDLPYVRFCLLAFLSFSVYFLGCLYPVCLTICLYLKLLSRLLLPHGSLQFCEITTSTNLTNIISLSMMYSGFQMFKCPHMFGTFTDNSSALCCKFHLKICKSVGTAFIITIKMHNKLISD